MHRGFPPCAHPVTQAAAPLFIAMVLVLLNPCLTRRERPREEDRDLDDF